MNTYAANRDHEMDKKARVGLGVSLGTLALLLALFNLAFIIPDLIFAGQQSDCVRTPVTGFPFTLDTWLRVDAYVRIGLLVFLILTAIISCINLKIGGALAILFSVLLILYTLFSIAWTIIGAIMFWGNLNPQGRCQGGVQIYMHILLILSFLGICCNFCSAGTQATALTAAGAEATKIADDRRPGSYAQPYGQPVRATTTTPVYTNPAVPSPTYVAPTTNLTASGNIGVRQTGTYPTTNYR